MKTLNIDLNELTEDELEAYLVVAKANKKVMDRREQVDIAQKNAQWMNDNQLPNLPELPKQ